MNLDRRSFRLGFAAALVALMGLVAGLLLSARFDWIAPAESQTPGTETFVPPPGAPTSFVPIAKTVMPAVVNISTTRVEKVPQRGQQHGQPQTPFDDPFFRRFFGEEFFRQFPMPRERQESSLGSGVIVSADGYIVTNNHVVAKAQEIKVLLSDKREFTGKVVGTDPKTDVAVIKISATNLPTIPWGDSGKLEVGEYVLAVGNPFGLNQTVTMGIVSALGRADVGITDYEDFIQTDAAINPGNSGGALVNTRGELVGMNTAIFSRTGGYQGIGFAVPSTLIRTVMDSLIKTGKVVRGYLGVTIAPVTPAIAKHMGLKETRGAFVQEVLPDSPAGKAGVQDGDVIVGFNGKPIDSPTTLRNTVAQTGIGKTVKLDLLRDGKSVTAEVRVVEQPKDFGQAEAPDEEEEGGEPGAAGTVLSDIEVRALTPEIAEQLNLPKGASGVVIAAVAGDSPAARTGISRGDVIVEINRMAVRNVADFKRLAARVGKNDSVMLRLLRNGRKMYVVLEPQMAER